MSPIMSVSGIRGKVGEDLQPEMYRIIAYIQTKLAGGGTIIVGRDTRPSGQILARETFRGIRLAGGIPIDIGIAPTPTTCFAVQHFKASGGIIITASHNPLPYNGYKMVHRSGRLMRAQECEEIYQQYRAFSKPSLANWDTADDSPAETPDASAVHIARIIGTVDAGAIRAANLTIAIDAINGAASTVFPMLLEKLHVSWEGINTALDGNFVHNPEPRPEHLGDLARLLHSHTKFQAGFAFDPDADRLAPMGENGAPISEEMTLALAIQPVLDRSPGPVAVNLSTSMVIDDVAAAYGVKVFRSKIGEAHVVECMQANSCRIGGEGNGGVIFPEISTVRDGLAALALILNLMATQKKTVSELISRWNSYPIIKNKIDLKGADASAIIARLKKSFPGEKIDMQDGLKIIREYGWVHLRPSNTEPIIRCYAEARSTELAQELADMIQAKLK